MILSKTHQSEAYVLENTVYKFCEKESECELLILEATPSQSESENIPVVPRGGFHNSYHYVNNKKMIPFERKLI